MVSSKWLRKATLSALLLATPVSAFASPFPLTSPARTTSTASGIRTSWTTTSSPSRHHHHHNTQLALSFPRGGASIIPKLADIQSTPQTLFHSTLFALAVLISAAKILQNARSDNTDAEPKPSSVVSLQRRFLPVFWILRCADWLQGPYFYEVYASKVFHGVQASMSLVSRLFLTGFASTALFGPSVGRAADTYGRKKATLAFCLVYALGAFSTKSPLLQILFVGRILSGIGTSLLFSAPESWLVGEAQKGGDDPDGKYLGETFGVAYAGDSIVAICAGQMAGLAASRRGPTGPFELSTAFLVLGGFLTAWLWKENAATTSSSGSSTSSTDTKPSIRDALQVIREDPKIMLVGGVQSLFEAAMYIFVLQWPPAMAKSIERYFNGAAVTTPYGTIFSCFMACCLLGSTIFGQLAKMNVPTEKFTAGFLSVATLAMSGATWMVSSSHQMVLWGLMASFFAFEACVGMYFPSIGTLRSKYVPDSHRSVIMNLFGIPLNVLVVSVFLSIQKLGVNGALAVSSGALGLATICMFQLRRMIRKEEDDK